MTWSAPVAAAALALLLGLAAGAGARGVAAWGPAGGAGADRSPVATDRRGSARPAGPGLAWEPRAAGLRGSAAPFGRGPLRGPQSRLLAGDPRPLVSPDPARVVAEVADGGDRRLVVLPAPARLADLLAAAGLPTDLPVMGAPGPAAPLAPGGRLVLGGGAPRLERMAAARRVRLGIPLDLNADPAEDLAALPEIGPLRARRIVEHRERRGAFKSVSGLLAVEGIGPATLARVRPLVSAGPGSR
jgi:competence protein ComEA